MCTWCRKVRGELPSLTEAEMQQYRSALYGVAAAVGHAPKLSLSGVVHVNHPYAALRRARWPVNWVSASHMNDIVNRASHRLGSTLLLQELLHLHPAGSAVGSIMAVNPYRSKGGCLQEDTGMAP